MKIPLALLSAFCISAIASPASAHPGHESSAPAYLAFWNGVPPKSQAVMSAGTAGKDIWRVAFVSKYRIVGVQLPTLQP